MPGFAFKVVEDDSDLEDWVEDYCNAHELRWNLTSTPSKYRSEEQRRRMLAVMRAWGREGVSIRFSLEAEGRRIAFVAGLVARDRLIYYFVCYAPSHAAFSPMLVLIRRMVLWMGQRGFTTLDFGVGGEPYKRRFADTDEPLWRAAAAPHVLSSTYARGVIEGEDPGKRSVFKRYGTSG